MSVAKADTGSGLSGGMEEIARELNALNLKLARDTVKFKKETEPTKLAKQLANS
jgi:hypothetical protein